MSRRVQRRAQEKRSLESNWDLVGPSAAAVERLWAEEIDLPERPGEGIPRLPSDPTDLDDAHLMSLFVQLTEWAAYQGARLAAAEVDVSSTEGEVKRLEALSAAQNAGEKRVTTAKAKAYEDPEYLNARDAYIHAYAYKKILSGIYEATDRKATVLSRELTRRVGREPRDNRSGKWGGS